MVEENDKKDGGVLSIGNASYIGICDRSVCLGREEHSLSAGLVRGEYLYGRQASPCGTFGAY